MKKIISKESACMGCGLCEVYCTVQHSKSKDIIKAYNREQPRPLSRIRREMSKPVSFAIQCKHCDAAPCVTACLSGAMHKNEKTGTVIHDAEKCIGCWSCIMVCPYGAIGMDTSGKVATKCDLCPELDVPACVANCPNEALLLKEVTS
ncbi:MAG: 4Fe-4S dicluster domain-containing protein [Candidatus Bathyarchaeia archaeon]